MHVPLSSPRAKVEQYHVLKSNLKYYKWKVAQKSSQVAQPYQYQSYALCKGDNLEQILDNEELKWWTSKEAWFDSIWI